MAANQQRSLSILAGHGWRRCVLQGQGASLWPRCRFWVAGPSQTVAAPRALSFVGEMAIGIPKVQLNQVMSKPHRDRA